MSKKVQMSSMYGEFKKPPMQFSYSRVSLYQQCPRRFRYQYIDEIKLIDDPSHDNALVVGNAIHLGLETTVDNMLKHYYDHYNIIDDRHVNEAIKLEMLVQKGYQLLNGINILHQEYEINVPQFKGIVDLITQNPDGTVDVFDFKYSNNVDRYMESGQLHIYKYFLEQQGFKVNRLGFIFLPKTMIRQKKTENLYQFRKRLVETLNELNIRVVEVKYQESKVHEFLNNCQAITQATEYPKNETKLCDWCEYQNYCQKGIDYEIISKKESNDMQLPSSERRDIAKAKKRKIWIYGPAFSGKTTMLDDAPNPLNLNTDGNIEFVTMPYIAIKDEVTVTGRVTNRKFAWEVLKDTIAELEKKQNDFKTIIVDLLEDTREMCRIYKYNEMGISHESDSGFGKGWDIIKTEYLATMRRLFNLDYENIVVLSHEDVSKDITKKNGQNVTRIAPNIQEAIANKVAGMVDIVARVVVDGDERTLNFKSDEVIFGGGRLKGISKTSIPLSWEELMKVYDEANAGKKDKVEKEAEKPVQNVKNDTEEATDEKPKETRSRKKKDEAATGEQEVAEPTPGESNEEAATEEKPKRTRRKKKED